MAKKAPQLAAKVSGNNTLDRPYHFAAITDLYFASAFLPDVPDRATVVSLHHTIDLPTDQSDPNGKKTAVNVLGIAVGDTSGYTSCASLPDPKPPKCSHLSTPQAPTANPRSFAGTSHRIRFLGLHRQAALHHPALHGQPWHL